MGDDLVLHALEVLRRACKDLQGVHRRQEEPQGFAVGGEEAENDEDQAGEQRFSEEEDDPCDSPSMKALLVLQSESQDGGLLSADAALSTLSSLLSRLRFLHLSSSQAAAGDDGDHSPLGDLGSGIGRVFSPLLGLQRIFLPGKRWQRPKRRRMIPRRRRSHCREIARVAGSIESEIQSWIDRESVRRLVFALQSSTLPTAEEGALVGMLRALLERLHRGFDRRLQDALLRSGAFPAVAAVLSSVSAPLRLRELCASAVAAMVHFNRDVFVGNVLMGGAGEDGSSSLLRCLATMGTPASMRVLRNLVAAIKTALVDELHADGQIPGLVGFLSWPDTDLSAVALELLLQVAYYARKEAVDAMLKANVVKRLTVLQRSDLGGAIIEMEDDDVPVDEGTVGCRGCSKRRRPFASCVACFAIQLEVGEGLRRREKAEAKMDILERVREAVASEAEAATIIAEVLWGASP